MERSEPFRAPEINGRSSVNVSPTTAGWGRCVAIDTPVQVALAVIQEFEMVGKSDSFSGF
jgi:hypothetical protein